MDKTQGKIGHKEFFAIIVLVVGTKLADSTPNILFEDLGNAAWLAIPFSCFITIFPLYLLTKVITHYKGKNLFDITNDLFGKYIGFMVLFSLWVLQSIYMIMSSAAYADIIETMYFTKTPIFIIYFLLMAGATYGAKKGLESIGSVAWVALPWIKISLIVVLVIVFFQGQFNFLFPILGPGEWEILKYGSLNASIYAELLFLALIADKIKSPSVYKRGIWISFIFITIEFILALIGYVMLFDYKGVKLISYPYHETIRYIQLGFITNVEALFFPFWLIATFIRFAMGLYINALLFGTLFKIQRFEFIVPALATIILFLGLVPENPVFTVTKSLGTLLHLITPIFLFFPFLLWIMAKVKGEFKK
ncbi:endospore germination permease [Lysinibacillus sp. BW-2-10]|uniref:GerAB/ArcD/ProY family transporter n=1 Tax=Lysinibacillus sp. BW-2-10 TaxID=2590030 RepID=UPI00118091A3|nr:endospore germination permease [Lysinibacillus sp. BW-2-10]TSI06027.1 GerAB/ArcD/ProY family transporter [Lysinibacillus sp. BW-2-10]